MDGKLARKEPVVRVKIVGIRPKIKAAPDSALARSENPPNQTSNRLYFKDLCPLYPQQPTCLEGWLGRFVIKFELL